MAGRISFVFDENARVETRHCLVFAFEEFIMQFPARTTAKEFRSMMDSCANDLCQELDVMLNDKHYGVIRCTDKGWRMTNIKPQSFIIAMVKRLRCGMNRRSV